MDWRINWTDPAIADLADIVRFIASDNRIAAEKVGNRIVDHVAILKSFPDIGPIFRHRPNGNVRHIICRPFKIFYRVQPESRVIEILHVWHPARQDPADI